MVEEQLFHLSASGAKISSAGGGARAARGRLPCFDPRQAREERAQDGGGRRGAAGAVRADAEQAEDEWQRSGEESAGAGGDAGRAAAERFGLGTAVALDPPAG